MSYTGHEFIEELKRLEQRLSYEMNVKKWRGEPKRTIYKGLNSRKRRRNQLYFNRIVEGQK
jgi:hypothetical protein